MNGQEGRGLLPREAGQILRVALDSWGRTFRLCVVLVTASSSATAVLWIVGLR
jgi:hypothetical protein